MSAEVMAEAGIERAVAIPFCNLKTERPELLQFCLVVEAPPSFCKLIFGRVFELIFNEWYRRDIQDHWIATPGRQPHYHVDGSVVEERGVMTRTRDPGGRTDLGRSLMLGATKLWTDVKARQPVEDHV